MSLSKIQLTITEMHPCSQLWSGMEGNARERHCELCGKTVFNLAAMTGSQVETLVRQNKGHLCARITLGSDGAIQTLHDRSQPSIAAGALLAASLAIPAMAARAQSPKCDPNQTKAFLTGKVLLADGSGPLANAVIRLEVDKQTVAVFHADKQGEFEISADPGKYDIAIGKDLFATTVIRNADLLAGEQGLGSIRVGGDTVSITVEPLESVATGGVMVAKIRYPFWYLFKHPIRYIRHLPHNF